MPPLRAARLEVPPGRVCASTSHGYDIVDSPLDSVTVRYKSPTVSYHRDWKLAANDAGFLFLFSPGLFDIFARWDVSYLMGSQT